MFEYFKVGIEMMWKIGAFRYAVYLNILLILFIALRRLSVVRHSKGDFFAPYHITENVFYIHNAFTFGKTPKNDSLLENLKKKQESIILRFLKIFIDKLNFPKEGFYGCHPSNS